MPVLAGIEHIITDADNNPLSGGKLRVYTANTTTLASLYSDVGLSVALSNPVIANAEGRLTSDGSNEVVVYAAAGSYDIAELTSANVVLRNWDDVSPGSGETGDINQVVTGNGRFAVTGSAGAVKIQAGDPDPDDIGGTLTFSGWEDTQADLFTFNATLVNVVGAFKVNSKKVEVVYTEGTAFTAVASVDVALPNVPAGVRGWRIIFYDLILSVSLSLQINLSYDGGATYKTGATDYGRANLYAEGATPTSVTVPAAGGTLVVGDGSNTTPTDRPGLFELTVFTPDSGSAATTLQGIATLHDSAGTPAPTVIHFAGYGLGGYGRCTHVRLLGSGGTITGKYRVVPLYGTGEA